MIFGSIVNFSRSPIFSTSALWERVPDDIMVSAIVCRMDNLKKVNLCREGFDANRNHMYKIIPYGHTGVITTLLQLGSTFKSFLDVIEVPRRKS